MVRILRKKNKNEKSLIKVNENNIFVKIRNFFRKNKKNETVTESVDKTSTTAEIQREHFKEFIKNIEDERTKLLKLQKQHRNGEIKEKDLTQVQIKSLCNLYDEQIETIQRSIQYRKQRILQYKKSL